MHLVNIVMMKMMMMEMTILMKEMTSKKIGKVTGWVCLQTLKNYLNLIMALALLDTGETSSSFSQKPPL